MAKLARYLGENIPAELVLASEPRSKPPMVLPDQPAGGRRRSMSVGCMNTDAPFTHASKPSMSQAEPDWAGEWNRSDIREVQRELRNLRAR